MKAVQRGEEQAFSALYYKYYLPLCRKAFRRIPEEMRVEEIVQDVFVALWNKADTLDATGNVSAWLYATLRNKVLHELRTESTRLKYKERLATLIPHEEHALYDSQIDAKLANERIMLTIDTLPAQCRQAFVLHRFESLSYREIADRMGISVKTVEKHIGRALAILRQELSEFDYSLAVILIAVITCQ